MVRDKEDGGKKKTNTVDVTSLGNKDGQVREKFNGGKKDNAERGCQNSYAFVAKGGLKTNGEKVNDHVMVLDESCVNQKDFSCCLTGKVKELGSLVNLKMVIQNEGFSGIGLKYLGGMWVMLVFNSKEAKEKFLACVTINMWFDQITHASSEFTIDDRVTWIDIEGIPLKLWTSNTFNKIASRWGSLIDIDKAEDDNFHSRRMCILTKGMSNIFETFKITYHGKVYWVRAKEISGWVPHFEKESEDDSDSESEQSNYDNNGDIDGSEEEQQVEDDISVVPDTISEDAKSKDDEGNTPKEAVEDQYSADPFGIYSILKKNNRKVTEESSIKESLKFPPGFTPREDGEVDGNVNDKIESVHGNSATYSKKNGTESVGSVHIHKVEIPRTGGSILSLMEELIKVGHTMGYNMDGCTKNIKDIVEVQGVDDVFR
uniref:DIE2/ALG10 family n=1 Tax=Tanacetum cinerariifolium TaxID=118510 RepID=A0A699H5X7_TANCI|nr:DIE2/ALG10 family [Tanacetum cinerariifolium]